MKISGIVLFVFLLTLLCSVKVYAQNNLFNSNDLSSINIDNYSDDEIASILQKANESGISETQLYKILANKGMPGSEIEKLKNRLTIINNKVTKNLPSADTGNTEEGKNVEHFYDTSNANIPLQKFKNDETIFGSELFTTNSLVFEPNLRISAPVGYILGPGDEIVVLVYGYSEKKYDLSIDDLGEIYIPNVGPILVNGLTIEKA